VEASKPRFEAMDAAITRQPIRRINQDREGRIFATVANGKRTLANRPQQTCAKRLVPCGSSILEPAGGIGRRIGEGLLTGHHFRKQPPGDRPERETVMGMTKREP